MSKAIDWLFELFEPDDYEGYDEEEIGYAGGLCMPEVCIALRGAIGSLPVTVLCTISPQRKSKPLSSL